MEAYMYMVYCIVPNFGSGTFARIGLRENVVCVVYQACMHVSTHVTSFASINFAVRVKSVEMWHVID